MVKYTGGKQFLLLLLFIINYSYTFDEYVSPPPIWMGSKNKF